MKVDKIIQNILALAFVKDFPKRFPKGSIYLVGGAVRDIIMGVEPKDVDLVAENVEFNDLHDFLTKHGKVQMIKGRAFGVIKFKPDQCHCEEQSDEAIFSRVDRHASRSNGLARDDKKEVRLIFDIALPRREEYSPGMRKKHAQVEHKNITIIDDLKRRDFTINAMAFDLRAVIARSQSDEAIYLERLPRLGSTQWLAMTMRDSLIDPFSGLNDINNKIIRAVGNPEERFLEDPTRILRAIRLAVKLNFSIEPATKKAMIKLAPEIVKKFKDEKGRSSERVSYEMIGAEFIKTFDLDPEKTINLYDKIGLTKLIFPEIDMMKGVKQPDIFHTEGDVFEHTLLTLRNLPKKATLTIKLATLLHDIGKPVTFTSAEMTGDRIRFHDHDKIGQEMSADVLKRIKMPKKLIDDIGWLVREHMKIFFAFPKMKKDRQKALVRNPLFDQLMILARADTLSSLRPNGRPDLGIMPKIEKIVESIRKEDREKPVEIINGHEIIEIIRKTKPGFDPVKEGKKIGKLKKEINSMYDRGEIKTEEEALELAEKWGGKISTRNS